MAHIQSNDTSYMSYEQRQEYIKFLASSITNSYVSVNEGMKQMNPEQFAQSWLNVFNASMKVAEEDVRKREDLRKAEEESMGFSI